MVDKKTLDGINYSRSEENAWCSFSYQQKQKNNNKTPEEMKLGSEEGSVKDEKIAALDKKILIFDRLYLKSDLIISLRLTEPSQWGCKLEEIYHLAGLNPEEIALSKTPLKLDDNPEMQGDDPDKINDWLKQQGATHLKDILYEPPASYKKIWNAIAEDPLFKNNIQNLRSQTYNRQKHLREADRLEIQNELKQTRAILMDYIGNYSRTKRFFTGHWNRHHIKQVYEALQNTELDSAIKLVTYVRSIVGDDLKPDGSLATRLRFIDQQIIFNEDRAKLAYSAMLKWEQEKLISPLKKFD